MSVHYKFKSTLNFDTITFDGLHISVSDLKREIVQQKRLGKVIDFDLQITNAQTKEEYKDEGFLIPKNTTLIISRIPIAHQNKKGWDPPQENTFAPAAVNKQENFNMDLSKMQGSEEDKIQAMMMQSTADYDPKTYHRIKGQSQVGEVPPSYRCNKCKKGGHWIKNCPFISNKDQFETKRNTGIPRSFRDKPEMTTEQPPAVFFVPPEEKQEIPEDLVCGICRDLFVDAVMIPCCGSSFCDDCVRTSLLESEDSECPDCKEKNCSPGSLIPNRFLRNSVNAFKNETGYKIGAPKTAAKPANTNPTETEVKPEEVQIPPQEVNEEKKEEPEKVEAEEPSQADEENEPPEAEQQEKRTDDELIQKDKEKSDSDYEDNITIKMPSQQTSEKVMGGAKHIDVKESTSQVYKETINTISQRRHPEGHYIQEREVHQPVPNKNEGYKSQNERSLLPTPISVHQNFNQNQMMGDPHDNKPLMSSDIGGGHVHRMNPYKPPYMPIPRGPPMHMMSHHMPPFNNGYNNVAHRPMGYGPYIAQPVNSMRAPYIPPGNMNINPPQTFQSNSLASIYQGVAAKVGTGLIDDPLEAFNRIMKEKEKQKGERRRSPDRHRSRTPDRQRHRFKSPLYDRDLSRDTNSKEKRARSRERKHDFMYDRRQVRSTRHSPRGSKSPSDMRKRPSHRRSPSPKPGYRHINKEKPHNKPYGSKIDTLEPPPPGFESLQIGAPHADTEPHRNVKMSDVNVNKSSSSRSDKVDQTKRPTDAENVTRKRQRSWSRTDDMHKDYDHINRSLTPPAKSKSNKVPKGKTEDSHKSYPRTPDRKIGGGVDFDTRDNVLHKRPKQDMEMERSSISRVSPEHLESVDHHMEKENEMDIDQSKERKKKKKVKSDRKKSKKDKKEKREKSKKSSSPTTNQELSKDPDNSGEHLDGQGLNDYPEHCTLSGDSNTNQKSSEFFGVDSKTQINDEISLVDNKSNKETECNKNSKKSFETTPNEKKLQRFDSVLDIEGYDTDFDESHAQSSKTAKKNDVDSFYISKWELEDNIPGDALRKNLSSDEHDNNAITSDVIRKAENAIFAKAIKAIRPVEFKVILDSKDNSKEAAISVRKELREKSLSPKRNVNKSVKDRLGSKVVREKVRTPERSTKEKRNESSSVKMSSDEKYSHDNYNKSRNREKSSRERLPNLDRRHTSRDRARKRPSPSNERESDFKSYRDRNREPSMNDNHKYKSHGRQRSNSRNYKHENNPFDDANDQNSGRNSRVGDNRVVSVAARPCAVIHNPFRRQGDGITSSNLLKHDSKPKHGSHSSQSGDSNSEDEQEKRKRKDKKFRRHDKYSSTESLRSEKQRRDLKSKRKSKVVKKKKKSKK